MKILLVAIDTKYIHSNPAVYSLKAYAEKKEPSLAGMIKIREYTINLQISDILADIYRKKPDMIGFSCYIWNIRYVLEIARELKKVLPRANIWLGGPEVSFDAEALLEKNPFLSGIITGEGEEAFLEVARMYLKKEEDNGEIDGSDIKKVVRGERLPLALSEVPFLYEDMSLFENRIIYYESGRGCPFRCSYCLSSIDKTVRLRDLDIVKKELDFFLEQKVSQVKFVDRTFNCNKKHALAIWEYLLANDNGITNFHFEIAADLLGEEELALLSRFRPGAVQLEIGVQTANEKTLAEIDRKMNLGKLKNVVEEIRKGKNIHVHLDLIAGLPYEDYESFGKSFDEVFSMKPEQLQLGFLKVLKGSKMHEKAEEYGLVYRTEPTYEVLFTNWITYEEICRLKRIEEMVEIYYNSNQFTVTLALAMSMYESPFRFFEELADYYEREGYFLKVPARSYRYGVLLSFLKEKERADEKLFAESLVVDLYLRENCKSRPDFAPDEGIYKDRIRSFYQEEAKEHRVLGKEYENYDARMLARNVHVEALTYDMESGEQLSSPIFMVFDYKKRNPLTYEAAVTTVYLQGTEK